MIFDALITSIKICVISLCISFFLSFIFSLYFSEKNNMVKKILEGIIIFPMFLPPSAVGYGLLLVFSKGSFIGKLLYETFNTSIIFTLSGAVIASVIISFPLMYKGMKGALLEINSEIKDSARDLGAKEW